MDRNEFSIVKEYSADEILCAALDIGSNILKNGGEIHRVEDTIERICKSFGASHVEVFSITSLIVASVRMSDGAHSQQMRRVYRTSNNIHLVEEMNKLSRELCAGKLELCDLKEKINAAKKTRAYPTIVSYIGAMFATGGFVVFFGGNVRDAICSAIVGVIMTFLDRHTPSFMNQMVMTVVNSIMAGVLSIFLSRIGLGCNPDKIIIGTIMLLIPGLAFGNSIREMLGGDVISGAVRMIHSILLAVMIAFGYAIAIMIMGGV